MPATFSEVTLASSALVADLLTVTSGGALTAEPVAALGATAECETIAPCAAPGTIARAPTASSGIALLIEIFIPTSPFRGWIVVGESPNGRDSSRSDPADPWVRSRKKRRLQRRG